MYQSDTSEDSRMMNNGSPTIKLEYTNLSNQNDRNPTGPKTWTPDDMESALDALRNHNMSLTKVFINFFLQFSFFLFLKKKIFLCN